MTTDRTKAIAELNDLFRMDPGNYGHLGHTFLAHGIASLPQDDRDNIEYYVGMFDDFTEENDPYGEHDFGSLEYEGHKVFWRSTTTTTA